jgi:hypothetical protein
MNNKALAILAIFLASGPVQAATTTFAETSDAGELLSSAQIINTQPAQTDLTTITGSLTAGIDNADLFQIFLSGGQTFSATTVTGSSIADTQLYLFDSSGLGIYANDDDNDAGSLLSTLPANLSFTPTSSGVYYLAVSGFNYNPTSASGSIFDLTSAPVVGPTGPGGGASLSGWTNVNADNTGSYTITLTGSQFVPEPSPLLALIAGALVIVARKKFPQY